MLADPLDERLGVEIFRLDPSRFGLKLDPENFRRWRYVALLGQRFRDAAIGRRRRQTIELPPGYGKSWLMSRWGPLWLLDLDPTKRIILASYNKDLATAHARWIRDKLEDRTLAGLLTSRLSENSTAAGRFDTPEGGGLLATGVHAKMIGYRAHMMVVDDAHEDIPAARSPVQSQETEDWFRSTVVSRLEPDASVLVIGHRLAPTDLTGRLRNGPGGDRWDNLTLPARATPTEEEPDPLGRKPGEVLEPERFSDAQVTEQEAETHAWVFASMWQQKPTSSVGTLFKRTKWGRVNVRPESAEVVRVRRWDLAATESGGDWTAGVLMAYTPDRRVIVEDVIRVQLGPAGVENLLAQTAAADGKKVWIRLEQEPGSAGKGTAANFVANVLAGFNAEAKPSSGSKFDRALPFSAQQLAGAEGVAGNVDLLCNEDGSPKHWHEAFIHEAAEFTGRDGDTDDQIDAASAGYLDLLELFKTHSKRKVKMRTAAGQSIGGQGLGNYR